MWNFHITSFLLQARMTSFNHDVLYFFGVFLGIWRRKMTFTTLNYTTSMFVFLIEQTPQYFQCFSTNSLETQHFKQTLTLTNVNSCQSCTNDSITLKFSIDTERCINMLFSLTVSLQLLFLCIFDYSVYYLRSIFQQ